MSFPEAATLKLLQYCPDTKPTVNYSTKSKQQSPTVAETNKDYQIDNENSLNNNNQPIHSLDIDLRSYQEQALINFKNANHRGILAMATGAGKTITALACASSIEDLDLIIIKELVNYSKVMIIR